MTIVFMSPEFPYPPNSGGRLRIFNLLKNLQLLGVDVILFVFSVEAIDNSNIESLRKYVQDLHFFKTQLNAPGNRLGKILVTLKSLFDGYTPYIEYFQTKDCYKYLRKVLQSNQVDLVHVELSYLAPYIKWLKTEFTDVPVVLGTQNVEMDAVGGLLGNFHHPIQKWLKHASWARLRKNEIDAFKAADCILATSWVDRDRIAEVAGLSDQVVEVPNGVDTNYFQRLPLSKDSRHQLLFSGQISHVPNELGLVWFYQEVYPLVRQCYPDIKLIIVGRDPTARIIQLVAQDSSVAITGKVDDVRTYFAKADIAIVPLHHGGGTRLKILESMAMGRPVISTTKGAEGILARSGQHLLLADNPSDFAQAIFELFEDHSLYERVADQGRSLVEELYDWKIQTKKVFTVYNKLVQKL